MMASLALQLALLALAPLVAGDIDIANIDGCSSFYMMIAGYPAGSSHFLNVSTDADVSAFSLNVNRITSGDVGTAAVCVQDAGLGNGDIRLIFDKNARMGVDAAGTLTLADSSNASISSNWVITPQRFDANTVFLYNAQADGGLDVSTTPTGGQDDYRPLVNKDIENVDDHPGQLWSFLSLSMSTTTTTTTTGPAATSTETLTSTVTSCLKKRKESSNINTPQTATVDTDPHVTGPYLSKRQEASIYYAVTSTVTQTRSDSGTTTMTSTSTVNSCGATSSAAPASTAKPQTNTATGKKKSKKISGGAIGGIVVGVIVGLVVLGLVSFYLWKRLRRPSTKREVMVEHVSAEPKA